MCGFVSRFQKQETARQKARVSLTREPAQQVPLCQPQGIATQHRSTVWKLGMNGIPPYLETHE